MTATPENRRPLKSRDTTWAKAAAAALARAGVSPNGVSAAALGFAGLGGAAFAASGLTAGGLRAVLLAAAAACIQLRLVCNLLDGLVAVEHGRGSPTGPIWNELPDRLADGLFLVGAGYGAGLAGAGWAIDVAWLAAFFAVLTAYVRELGRGLGQPADFCGPGAKPQRMAILTAAALVAVAEPLWRGHGEVQGAALGLIVLLSMLTVVRRTSRLAAALRGSRRALSSAPHHD